VICRPFSIIVVPFPFVDKAAAKKRPALVLSTESFNRQGHTVMAMITTKGHLPWPGDFIIGNLPSAGLEVPCIVRPKFFTLDNRLILRQLGTLAAKDIERARELLRTVLALPGT
jgi:mRNA interferase MazF